MDVSNEHKYIPAFTTSNDFNEEAWILILIEKKLLMKKVESKYEIPAVKDIKSIISDCNHCVFIGKYDGHDCYSIRITQIMNLNEDLELVETKDITVFSGDPGLFLLAGTANHIVHWNSMNRFCGRCGSKTMDKKDERAKVCPDCGNIIYPRISPATITAVFRGNQILLAHNRNFKNDLYSLIAGFVEPGETLEQCVEREIKEEVGIQVKNIKYFSSQPWSFPDSLMMAFTAEYESGDLMIDNSEITDAGWYTADNLPDIPSTDSVAGKIIRWYREKYLNN